MKVHTALPVLHSNVSKGTDLTFDPDVREKSKSKVGPKKKFARTGRIANRSGSHLRRRRYKAYMARVHQLY